MSITIIKKVGSAQLATELEEQPKFTAETLRDIALDMDEPRELTIWAEDVAAHCDANAHAVIAALHRASSVAKLTGGAP